MPAGWLADVTAGDQTAHLKAASDELDGYFASRFKLPLTSWGADVKRKTCAIAAYTLMVRAGFNPDSGADVAIRNGHEDALTWAKDVAKGLITPVGVVDSTPTKSDAGPRILTSAQRGW